VLLVGALVTASPAPAQQFGAESFTLANGVQVVVLPNHRARPASPIFSNI
jgi:predicted Zn-dependent peptidase